MRNKSESEAGREGGMVHEERKGEMQEGGNEVERERDNSSRRGKNINATGTIAAHSPERTSRSLLLLW